MRETSDWIQLYQNTCTKSRYITFLSDRMHDYINFDVFTTFLCKQKKLLKLYLMWSIFLSLIFLTDMCTANCVAVVWTDLDGSGCWAAFVWRVYIWVGGRNGGGGWGGEVEGVGGRVGDHRSCVQYSEKIYMKLCTDAQTLNSNRVRNWSVFGTNSRFDENEKPPQYSPKGNSAKTRPWHYFLNGHRYKHITLRKLWSIFNW